MATNNFHNVNASRIFACEIQDEFDYEDLKVNLESDLEQLPNWWPYDNVRAADGLRSYPAICLGQASLEKYYRYKGEELCIEAIINPVIRSGYYSGCNLDWTFEYAVCGHSQDTLDFKDSFEYYGDMSEAMARRYANWAELWAEGALDDLRSQLEKIYAQHSIQLVKLGSFSNGEAIYQKA